ncbi:MAG: glutamine--fructose-6-phosphate transaminase (isomerizing) [Solirubrobacterales bacterium]|nr:glutamine--fructose-6-phosphate transaminase (isomerizing) [Solirubrobacterales bacterium]
MCGIVGYVGRQDGVPVLLEGLARVEYRGYDSAGLAVAKGGALRVHKKEGRVGDLAASLPKRLSGTTGIAHTRWATHGPPSDVNAHPHVDTGCDVAVVHNGMLENAEELRAELQAAGVALASDTDTEVLAHLIAADDDVDDLEGAVARVLQRVTGSYGIAVLHAAQPDRIVIARNGSPVIIGIGERETMVSSDVAALVRHCRQVVHLDDGELATLTKDGFQASTLGRRPSPKQATELDRAPEEYEKGGFQHFLAKEIHEQPEAVERALSGRIEDRFATAHLGGIELTPRELRAVRRIKVLGCGSAYYSGLMGAGLIEALARVPADAEPAAEFRQRNPLIEPDTLYIAVSQSGETLDTLLAVEEVRRKGGRVLGMVNVVGSSIARAVEGGIHLRAGAEVSVASTKSFTNTVVAFALLALHLGRVRDLSPADGERLIAGLRALPGQIAEILEREDEIAAVAERLAPAHSAFFIGRVSGFPAALEGAQKLKEVSYIHAEAYPASELKHGPLALISPEMPSVCVVPDDHLVAKNRSAIEQIRARGGETIVVAQTSVGDLADAESLVPRCEPELAPLLLNIPLQVLAYHAAVELGRDVDQPRNLAKSVTVE